MLEFVGYCNGAPSKSQCAAFDRKLAHKITVPVTQNGAILTGKTLDGVQLYQYCLVVIDFDVKPDEVINILDIPELCYSTMIVRTGGGGLHCYFSISDGIVGNESHKNPKSDCLKGVDVRGEGGIIFAPGCKFTDHQRAYTQLEHEEPLVITKAVFEEMMTELLEFEPVPLSFSGMRQGFIDIVEGKYIIPHIKDEKTGVEEQVIWKAFYRELYNCGIEFNTVWSIWGKHTDLQPEFDQDTAQYQITKIRSHMMLKRPSTKLYQRIFPQYKQKKEPKEDKPWYFLFEEYWEENFAADNYWIVDWEKWVQYTPEGYFVSVPEEEFKDVVYKWLDAHDLTSSITKRNIVKDRIVSEGYKLFADFKGDLNIRNCKNGLLHLDDLTLHPHTNQYLNLYQCNANYLTPEELQPTPCWDQLRAKYPIEIQKVEWYLRCILYNKMENEVSLFIVGVNRSSKGSTLGMIKEMFPPQITSHQSFELFGEDFGLAPLLGKNLNLDNEGTITKLKAEAVKYWKAIVGRDGIITVNSKHAIQVDNDFDPFFFLFAMNQLYRLPPTDLAAFFVRCFIVVFSTREMNPDPTFKDRLKLEVDSIFSKLIQQGYEPLQPFYERVWGHPYDVDTYTNEMKTLWDAWSNSINIVCISLFVKDEGDRRMEVEEVLGLVMEGLGDRGYPMPKDQVIKMQTTKALKKMGILRQKSGEDNYYRPIRLIEDFTTTAIQRKLDENIVRRAEP